MAEELDNRDLATISVEGTEIGVDRSDLLR
jgi:hypothetical protein